VTARPGHPANQSVEHAYFPAHMSVMLLPSADISATSVATTFPAFVWMTHTVESLTALVASGLWNRLSTARVEFAAHVEGFFGL
jgi:hypothetical protein